jgi:two-component system sensor histidine kinase TctE
MKSLTGRLLLALLIPFAILVAIAAAITCWVVYNEQEVTADRVLVGSVRTLSLAFNAPEAVRPKLVPLAVNLLKRRARPHTYYSVHHRGKLVAGYPELAPPEDHGLYWEPVGAAHRDRHQPAEFSSRYAPTLLYRGHINVADGKTVIQAAYLRDGSFHGGPARIATEIRQAPGFDAPLIIQVANPVDTRRAWQVKTFFQIYGVAAAILLLAGLLFWWAVLWGLRPFRDLTHQVETHHAGTISNFRLTLPHRAPRETRPFVAAFNSVLARTEKASEFVRQFTADASHQMRTPLAVLRAHLHILKRHAPESREGLDAIADIDAAVRTLERLLMQLIALARAEEQDVHNVREPFDLAGTVASVARERAPVALQAGLDIAFEAVGSPLAVYGNSLLASELVRNLVDNAICYCPRGSHISIRVTATGDRAQVAVEDDGPGIPQADRSKVFQRFYRLARDSDRAGSGLGLPIVRALAERMGAEVRLHAGANGRGLLAVTAFQRVPASAGSAGDTEVQECP